MALRFVRNGLKTSAYLPPLNHSSRGPFKLTLGGVGGGGGGGRDPALGSVTGGWGGGGGDLSYYKKWVPASRHLKVIRNGVCCYNNDILSTFR